MRRFNRGAGTIVAVLTTLSMVVACGSSRSGGGSDATVKKGDTINIGVSTVATGPLAINDQATKALSAYFKLRNDQGGIAGHQVKLKSIDSQGTVAGGATAARTLLAAEPFAIFQLSTAPFSGAQAVYKSAPETPVLVLANGSVVKAAGLPNTFGTFTDYTTESFVGIEHLAGLGKKKMALVYDPTIGEDAAKHAPDEAKKHGVEIVKIPVPATTTNYDPIVQKLRSSGAEGIVFQVVAQSIVGTMKAAKRAGLDLPAISYSGQLNQSTLDLGGEAIEGMYFSGLFPLLTDESPAVKEFTTQIKKYAPDAATVLGELGWTTGAIIEAAVKDASKDGDLTQAAFMDALRGLGGQQVGVLETVGWTDSNVNSIDAGKTDVFSMYQVRDGAFVKVDR